MTLTVHRKPGKIRYLPVHPRAVGLIQEYLEASGHAGDGDGVLFRPVKRPDGKLEKPITSDSVYRNVVMKYAKELGISVEGFGPHALCTTAATNALEHNADISKVQGVARPRGHFDDAALRQAQEPPGGFAHVQGGVLSNSRLRAVTKT